MSDGFDPYLQWLGIRDPERPPNAYRLLGLELFEPDANVISNAADRQMAHVRSFAIGPQRDACQMLLNELSAARIKLLNPAKKAQYDAELASSRLAPVATSEPKSLPVAIPLEERSGIVDFPTTGGSHRSSRSTLSAKRKPSMVPYAIVSGIALLVIGIVAYSMKSNSPVTTTLPAVQQQSTAPKKPPKRVLYDRQPRQRANDRDDRPIPGLGSVVESNHTGDRDAASPIQPAAPVTRRPADEEAPVEEAPEEPKPVTLPVDGKFGSIRLPSGAEFNDDLAEIDADQIREVFKDERLQKTTNTNASGRVEGILCYNDKGFLHGPQVIFLADNSPRAFGFYKDAKRDGVLRLWNENGERRLFAVYKNGHRDGLYILFDHNLPFWIEEYDNDKQLSYNLVNYESLPPTLTTFASLDDAKLDEHAAIYVERVAALEEEMNLGERNLRHALNEWHGKMVEAQRRALRAATASARRELTRQRDQLYTDMQRQADGALNSLINGTHMQFRRGVGT